MLSALQARIRIVQSPSNARVKALRRAVTHAPALARMHGADPAPEECMALEGFHLVGEALRAGGCPSVLFLRQGEEAAALTAILEQAAALAPQQQHRLLQGAELLALPPGLFNSLLDTTTPQPAAALLPVPAARYAAVAPALLLVLCGLQDPGNVGALLRSALAFGATGALLLRGTASPWSSRALRASAGAGLHMPLAAVADAAEARAALRGSGARSYALAPRGGLAPQAAALRGPAALWVGAEGSGLSSAEMAACDATLTLPMAAQAESLNAAIAGSLLLYEAARARSASNLP